MNIPTIRTPVIGAPPSPQLPATPQAPAARVQRPIPNIIIIGESGFGKTRSLKSLPWASGSVAYIDTEQKGAQWMKAIPDDCYFAPTDSNDVLLTMTRVEANPKFKYVVVDSFTGFTMLAHLESATKNKGYDIYTHMNASIQNFLRRCISPNKRWIVTAIPEFLQTDSGGNTLGQPIKRAAVPGRMAEGTIESKFAYAVFLKVFIVPNQKPAHKFMLYTDGITQAKIPEGVTDAMSMDNDVWELVKLAEKAEAS